MYKRLLGLMVVLTVLAIASQASANLIQNGSFEEPVVPFEEWPPDPLVTSVTGWSTIFGNFNLCGINSWDSAVGNQNLDLAGDTNGALMQTITTVAGQEYTLSFYQSDNPYMSLPSTATVTVIDSGTEATLIDQTYYGPGNNSPDNMDWQLVSMNFTAISSSTMLAFEAQSPNGYASPTLDGVAVEPVPEPATLMLMAAGLPVLLKHRRRRG